MCKMKFYILLGLLITYFGLNTLGPVASSKRTMCPSLYLPHGRIRFTDFGHKAKLKCDRPYVLLGEEVIVCNNGTWSSSFNICARKDCPKLPKMLHGELIVTKKVVAKPICDPHFILVGSPLLYCNDASHWNDSVPQCMASNTERFIPCNFEFNNPPHCRWLMNPSTYKWTVTSSNQNEWQSRRPDVDLPPTDHTLKTLEPHDTGHFLLLTRNLSSKHNRKKSYDSDEEAEFISPLLPPTADANETLCLVFYFYIHGPHSGFLKVLINNETVWQNRVSENDYEKWTKHTIDLRNQKQRFRVVLKGSAEAEDILGLAIDDLELLRGDDCNFTVISTESSSTEEIKDSDTTSVRTSTVGVEDDDDVNIPSSTDMSTSIIKNTISTSYDINSTVVSTITGRPTTLTRINSSVISDHQESNVSDNILSRISSTISHTTTPALFINTTTESKLRTSNDNRILISNGTSSMSATKEPITLFHDFSKHMKSVEQKSNHSTVSAQEDHHVYSYAGSLTPTYVELPTDAPVLKTTNEAFKNESRNNTDYYNDYEYQYDDDPIEKHESHRGIPVTEAITTLPVPERISALVVQHPTTEASEINDGLDSFMNTSYSLSAVVSITITIFLVIIFAKLYSKFKSNMLDESRVNFLSKTDESSDFSGSSVSLKLVKVGYPTITE